HPPIKALARRHLEEGLPLLLREATRERPCPFHSVQEEIAGEQLQWCPQLPSARSRRLPCGRTGTTDLHSSHAAAAPNRTASATAATRPGRRPFPTVPVASRTSRSQSACQDRAWARRAKDQDWP